jgi:hypothetical protein
VIRTHGDDLHPSLVEFRPQFFPSPQLGDTVGSPVCPKKLDQYDVAMKAL